MKKISKDERGLVGFIEIGLVLILVGVIAFAGSRVYNATRQADQSNQEAVKISAETPEFKKVAQIVEEEKTSTEEPAEKTTEPIAETTTKPKTEETPKTEEKPQPTQVGFTLTSSEVLAESIVFSGGLDQNRSGYCYIKLYKDGYEKLYAQSANFTSQNSCSVTLEKSAVPAEGEWTGYIKFFSSDGKFYGYDEIAIDIDLDS